MTPHLLPLDDALLLRKRGLIDAVIDLLKNQVQIEHARHRNVTGFLANLLAGLIAYCHTPAKPSLHHHQDCFSDPVLTLRDVEDDRKEREPQETDHHGEK